MKKVVLSIVLVISLLALCSCGNSSDSDKTTAATTTTQATTAATTQAATTTQAVTEASTEADDGVIDFTSDSGTIVYTKHEITKTFEGKPALLVYFDYTNTLDEGSSAELTYFVQAFQNGIECEVGILTEAPDEYVNTSKDIKTGVTLPVAMAFELQDETTDVELEVSELFSFSDDLDTQVISLK